MAFDEEEYVMLIHVQYTDNRFDYVDQLLLDDLLDMDKIAGFRRSSGWVTVGVDPIRKERRSRPRDVRFLHMSSETH